MGWSQAAPIRIDDHIDYHGYFVEVDSGAEYSRIPARYSLSNDPNVITVEIRRRYPAKAKPEEIPKTFYVESINVRYRQVTRYEYSTDDSKGLNVEPISTQLFIANVTRGREILFTPATLAPGDAPPEDAFVPQDNAKPERWARKHVTERRAFINVPTTGWYSWGPDYFLGAARGSSGEVSDVNEGSKFARCFQLKSDFNKLTRMVSFSYKIEHTYQHRIECFGNFSNPDPHVFGDAPSYFLYNEDCRDMDTWAPVRQRVNQTIRAIEDGSFEILVQPPHWTEYLYPCRYQSVVSGPLALASLGELTDNEEEYSGVPAALRKALTHYNGDPVDRLDGLYSVGQCQMFAPHDEEYTVGANPAEFKIRWFLSPESQNMTGGGAAGELQTLYGSNRFILKPVADPGSEQGATNDDIVLLVNQCPSYISPFVPDIKPSDCDPRTPYYFDTKESLPTLVTIVFKRCNTLSPDALFGRFLRQDNAVFEYVLATPTAREGPYPDAPVRCERLSPSGELGNCHTILMEERKLIPRVGLDNSSIPADNSTKFILYTFAPTGAMLTTRLPISQLGVSWTSYVWDSREDLDRYVPLDQGQFILNGQFRQPLGPAFHDSYGSETVTYIRGKHDVSSLTMLAGHRPQGYATMYLPEVGLSDSIECSALVVRNPSTGQMVVMCKLFVPQDLYPNAIDIRDVHFVEPFEPQWFAELKGEQLYPQPKSFNFDVMPVEIPSLDGLWRGPFAVSDDLLGEFDDSVARRIDVTRPRRFKMQSLSAPSSGNAHAFWSFVQARAIQSLPSDMISDISACRPITISTKDLSGVEFQATRYAYARDYAFTSTLSAGATRQCRYKVERLGSRAAFGNGTMTCTTGSDDVLETSSYFWSFPSGDRSLIVLREHINAPNAPAKTLLGGQFPIVNAKDLPAVSGVDPSETRGGVTAIFVRCPAAPNSIVHATATTDLEKVRFVNQSNVGNVIGEGLLRPLAYNLDVQLNLSPNMLTADRRISSNTEAGRDIGVNGFAQFPPKRPYLAAAVGTLSPRKNNLGVWENQPVFFSGYLGSPRPGLDPDKTDYPVHFQVHFREFSAENAVHADPAHSHILRLFFDAKFVHRLATDDPLEPLPDNRPEERGSFIQIADDKASGVFWIDRQRESHGYPEEWKVPVGPVISKADALGVFSNYLYDYAGMASEIDAPMGVLEASALTGSIGTRVSVLTATPSLVGNLKMFNGYWAEIDPIETPVPPQGEELAKLCERFDLTVYKDTLYKWQRRKPKPGQPQEFYVFSPVHQRGYGYHFLERTTYMTMFTSLRDARMRFVTPNTTECFPGTLRATGLKTVRIRDYIPCETLLKITFTQQKPVEEATSTENMIDLILNVTKAADLYSTDQIKSIDVAQPEPDRSEFTFTLSPMNPDESRNFAKRAGQRVAQYLERQAEVLGLDVSSIVTTIDSSNDPAPQDDSKKGKNNKTIGIVIGVLLGCILVGGLGYYWYKKRRPARFERVLEEDVFYQAQMM